MPDRSDQLTLPRLLICEGREDVLFFQRLIDIRHLPHFHLRDTAGTRGSAGGNTRFGSTLMALSAKRGFAIIRDIVLVGDSDEDRDASFAAIQAQVSRSGIGAPPDRPNQRSGSRPRITIVMLPLQEPAGCLESTCIPAARRADWLLAAHVDDLAASVVKPEWPTVRRDKFWLRCQLAGRASDPFVPLGQSFGDSTSTGLIALNDPAFDDIAALLARFGDDAVPPPRDGNASPAGNRQTTRRDRRRPRPETRPPRP